MLARAWAAGAGPGDGPLTIDLDSTICEADQGRRPPPWLHRPAGLSSAAGRRRRNRRLMCRLREGRANTTRGAAHFLRETVGRVRYAGATGPLTARADSGFYTRAIVAVCRKMDVRFSITVRQHQSLRNLIEAIPEADWTPIPYWMDGAADVAETTYVPFESKPDAAPVRLIVRRREANSRLSTGPGHAFITIEPGRAVIGATPRCENATATSGRRGTEPSPLRAANAAWSNLAHCGQHVADRRTAHPLGPPFPQRWRDHSRRARVRAVPLPVTTRSAPNPSAGQPMGVPQTHGPARRHWQQWPFSSSGPPHCHSWPPPSAEPHLLAIGLGSFAFLTHQARTASVDSGLHASVNRQTNIEQTTG